MAVAALAAIVNAAFFSFVSDNDSATWTFSRFAASVTDADDQRDPQFMLIDDDNGVLPTLAFQVEFGANFSIV